MSAPFAPWKQTYVTEAESERVLKRRLLWIYGPERTASILSGTDPATLSDLEAWARLGRLAERRS